MTDGNDPFDLQRFVTAQARCFPDALAELRAGRKRTHWMWFIFPQLAGLGHSAMARRYAISSLAQAQAFLTHPLLGPRLIACCDALLAVRGRTAHDILGAPNDLKLRSCMTLFAQVAPAGSVFRQVLERYYEGRDDPRTLALLPAE